MPFQLFNHCYYRVCSCCLGCRSFVDDRCIYVDMSCGKCFGFCRYNPPVYRQLSFNF